MRKQVAREPGRGAASGALLGLLLGGESACQLPSPIAEIGVSEPFSVKYRSLEGAVRH
jgi:uncharacterized membrane protein YebE (DUF533 family)